MAVEMDRASFLKLCAFGLGTLALGIPEIGKGGGDGLWGTYTVGLEDPGALTELGINNSPVVVEKVLEAAKLMNLDHPGVVCLEAHGQEGKNAVLPLVWSGGKDSRMGTPSIKQRFVGWGMSGEELVSADSGNLINLVPLAELTIPNGAGGMGRLLGPMRDRSSVEPFIEFGGSEWMFYLPLVNGNVRMLRMNSGVCASLRDFLSK